MKTTIEVQRNTEASHQTILISIAKQARDLALKEQPSTDDSARNIQNGIRSKYTGLSETTEADLSPETERIAIKADTELKKVEELQLEKAVAAKWNEVQNGKLDHPESNNVSSVPLRALLVGVVTLLVLISESAWLGGAFEATGNSKPTAMLIAFGITVLLGVFASATVHLIRKAKRKATKVTIGVAALSIVGVLYYVLGHLRAKYLSELLGSTEGLIVQPWTFVAISVVTFVALATLAMAWFPATEEFQEYRAHLARIKKQRTNELELARLQAEKDRIPQKYASRIEERAHRIEVCASLKRRIEAMCIEALSAFAQENSSRRSSTPPSVLFSISRESRHQDAYAHVQ